MPITQRLGKIDAANLQDSLKPGSGASGNSVDQQSQDTLFALGKVKAKDGDLSTTAALAEIVAEVTTGLHKSVDWANSKLQSIKLLLDPENQINASIALTDISKLESALQSQPSEPTLPGRTVSSTNKSKNSKKADAPPQTVEQMMISGLTTLSKTDQKHNIFAVVLPDQKAPFCFVMSRGAFIKKITTLAISNGVLQGMHIEKPSEVLGFSQIPLNISQQLASLPQNLLSVKVNYLTGQNNLLTQQADLLKAQAALINAQAALAAAKSSASPTP